MKTNYYLILGFAYLMLILGLLVYSEFNQPEFISPCPPEGCEVVNWDEMVTPSPVPSPIPTEENIISANLTGLASYYSIDGCLGCNPDRITASGEKLDDNKYTMAMDPLIVNKYKLIGKYLKVTNQKTEKTLMVKVNDTGGFSKYNRIADLSLATKNYLECEDLCNITIDMGL